MAIIVTDQGLTQPANKAVIEKIINYVRGGGLAIIGLHFTRLTNGAAFKAFFRNFGLPWESADCCSKEFSVQCRVRAANGSDATCYQAVHYESITHQERVTKGEK